MAAGVTAISSTAADEAREELKEYNQSAIAAAKASGRQLPLDLKAPDSSTKLQRACTECETVCSLEVLKTTPAYAVAGDSKDPPYSLTTVPPTCAIPFSASDTWRLTSQLSMFSSW